MLRSAVVLLIIWLQDVYIGLALMMNSLWFKVVVFAYNILPDSEYQVLAAWLDDGRNVTGAVKLFYMFDTIQSCASLRRWLARFGYNQRVLNIVHAGSRICISKIDLYEDRELLSGDYDWDGSLAGLSGKVI